MQPEQKPDKGRKEIRNCQRKLNMLIVIYLLEMKGCWVKLSRLKGRKPKVFSTHCTSLGFHIKLRRRNYSSIILCMIPRIYKNNSSCLETKVIEMFTEVLLFFCHFSCSSNPSSYVWKILPMYLEIASQTNFCLFHAPAAAIGSHGSNG